MAVGASLLTTGFSNTSATSFNTASVTPTANELIAIGISSNASLPSSVSGNGLTWVAEQTFSTNGFHAVYRAMGASPSAGAITIDFGATTQTAVIWNVVDCSVVDTSGSNGSGAVRSTNDATASGASGTSLIVTMPQAINSGNATLAFIGHGTAQTQTAGSGYTKLGESQDSGTIGDWAVEFNAAGTNTPDMSWATSDVNWGMALEIVAAGAAAPVDYDPLWRYRLRPPGVQTPNYAPFPGPLGDATVPGPPAIWVPGVESQYGTFF